MSSKNAVDADSYGTAGLLFVDRSAMRDWLENEESSPEAAWLVFGKRGGPKTLSATEALEEALCHGWIDGQMKRIDELAYVKYFAPRRSGSVWSARNRSLVAQLDDRGLMTQAGHDAVNAAKAGGTWENPVGPAPSEAQIDVLDALIGSREPARANWLRMSPSVRRTYSAFYLDAKAEPTRVRRLERILDRLDKNLKPM